MTNREKMLAGEIYDTTDSELVKRRVYVHELVRKFNNTNNTKKKSRLLKKIIPNQKENAYIEGPIHCDYGDTITLGKNFYANFNLTILDCAQVIIGDNVMIGPNGSILTPIHPFHPQERNFRVNEKGKLYNMEFAKKVVIEDDCWIAGNVTICGGVTIGKGCVIGAGSVVTKDIPPYSLAYGNPCKVIRQITEQDKLNFDK